MSTLKTGSLNGKSTPEQEEMCREGILDKEDKKTFKHNLSNRVVY